MNKFSKFLKHGKRLVAIMLVLFMNINSFATTTSNDGSAFITKAEFDSLINNFNEQMDIYQSGFNAKIDTSIAQYLAGLATQTSTTLPVLNPLWSEVSAFNGKIAPTFTIPDLNIYYGGGAKGYVSWSGGYKRYSLSISARYTYSNGNKNTRALVKCKKLPGNPGRSIRCNVCRLRCRLMNNSFTSAARKAMPVPKADIAQTRRAIIFAISLFIISTL